MFVHALCRRRRLARRCCGRLCAAVLYASSLTAGGRASHSRIPCARAGPASRQAPRQRASASLSLVGGCCSRSARTHVCILLLVCVVPVWGVRRNVHVFALRGIRNTLLPETCCCVCDTPCWPRQAFVHLRRWWRWERTRHSRRQRLGLHRSLDEARARGPGVAVLGRLHCVRVRADTCASAARMHIQAQRVCFLHSCAGVGHVWTASSTEPQLHTPPLLSLLTCCGSRACIPAVHARGAVAMHFITRCWRACCWSGRPPQACARWPCRGR